MKGEAEIREDNQRGKGEAGMVKKGVEWRSREGKHEVGSREGKEGREGGSRKKED